MSQQRPAFEEAHQRWSSSISDPGENEREEKRGLMQARIFKDWKEERCSGRLFVLLSQIGLTALKLHTGSGGPPV